MATTKDEIEKLLDAYEPEIRKAFMEAIEDLTDSVVISRVIDRLEAGDLDGAATAIDIDPVAFNKVSDTFVLAYRDAGTAAVASLPLLRDTQGAKVVIRFNVRNPTAEDWLRKESSRLVRGLTDAARDSVRQALATGMEQGLNPRTTALDVVGRINKSTGRREGGVLGLTTPQTSFVQNARDELKSNDPALYKNYLSRVRRDKRFDPAVKRSIASGKPIPAETIVKMVAKYSDSLLKLRGDTIARTETLLSIHAGQAEAMRQAIQTGAVSPQDVTKKWHDVRDGRVRHSHRLLNGVVVPYEQPFVSVTTGSKLMHPGDRSLGAAASEIINCRCHAQYLVDYISQVARRARAARQLENA